MAATFDQSTQRGQHVAQRLADDTIAWLTTVRPSGQPDSVPIWFLYQDGIFIIYSRPSQQKIANIQDNPHVTLTIDNTHGGGDVIRIEGTAAVDPDFPPCEDVPAYVEKYADGIAHIGYGSAQEFGEVYSVAFIVTPTRFRI